MARNERLADAIVRSGMTVETLGEKIGYHPKSVRRWISGAVRPERSARLAVSAALNVPEAFLFPGDVPVGVGCDELEALYATRAEMPTSVISTLARDAGSCIHVHAYAATWLWDAIPGFVQLLVEANDKGVDVKVCLGDPASDAVRVRGEEEGIGEGMAARCRLALNYVRPLLQAAPEAVRITGTTLYTSLYQFDDDILINMHLYGNAAAINPVLHCHRRSSHGVVANAEHSFDTIWDQAAPVG